MRLSNFLTALAIFHGPPLGTSSAEILDYLFRCFDLDDTNTLDKVVYGSLLHFRIFWGTGFRSAHTVVR